jgi:hypothetical protein
VDQVSDIARRDEADADHADDIPFHGSPCDSSK